jgi:hypothetical protein
MQHAWREKQPEDFWTEHFKEIKHDIMGKIRVTYILIFSS